MTQAVNYTVNFTGNFTTLASAFAGIGTDLTYTASGTCTGGTASTITLASGTTSACIGHTLLWNGNRYLIGAFNTSTLVATLAALAGYPASFAGTPASGNAYTIDDVAVTLTIGQSAAGNNRWAIGATLTLGAIATSATNTLTLQGATPWNPGLPLTPNTGGLTTQAVFLAGAVNYAALLTASVNNVVINDLAFGNSANGPVVSWGGASLALNRVFFQANASQVPFYSGTSVAVTAKNCIFRGGGGGYVNSNGSFTGCLFLNMATGLTRNYGSPVANDCGFFGCGAITGGATLSNCASDLAGTAGVTQRGAASTQFVNATADFRPLASGGLVGLGGANTGIATDIYGAPRNAAHVTVGAAENGYAPPATQSLGYAVNYAGDVSGLAPVFVGTGAVSGAVLTISAVTSGNIAVGDTVLYSNNGATSAGTSLVVTSLGSGTGGTGTYNLSGSDTSSSTYTEIDVPALSRQTGSDLTYFQQGLTCPATSGSNTQIVLDPTATVACLGHPIQWKTGAIGMITGLALVSGNLVATISAVLGYPANFGGVPQAGDAYTIFPTSVTFTIGQSAAGNRLWDLHQSVFGSGAVYLAAKTSATSTLTLTGAYAFDAGAALGTILGSGSTSAVAIANHGDHRSVLQVNSPALNVFVSRLQLWSKFSSETAAEDGCFVGTGAVAFNGCLLRGDNFSDDGAHSPGIYLCNPASISLTNCVVMGNHYHTEIGSYGNNWKFCTVINTDNTTATLTAPAASGATSLTLNSTAGIAPQSVSASYDSGMLVGGPVGALNANGSTNYANLPGVNGIAGNVVTLNVGTTAAIASGTPLYFGAGKGIGTQFASLSIANCAIFGYAVPVDASHGATITTQRHRRAGAGRWLDPGELPGRADRRQRHGRLECRCPHPRRQRPRHRHAGCHRRHRHLRQHPLAHRAHRRRRRAGERDHHRHHAQLAAECRGDDHRLRQLRRRHAGGARLQSRWRQLDRCRLAGDRRRRLQPAGDTAVLRRLAHDQRARPQQHHRLGQFGGLHADQFPDHQPGHAGGRGRRTGLHGQRRLFRCGAGLAGLQPRRGAACGERAQYRGRTFLRPGDGARGTRAQPRRHRPALRRGRHFGELHHRHRRRRHRRLVPQHVRPLNSMETQS